MNNLIPEHLAAYAHSDSLQIEGGHRCFSLSCQGRDTFHIRYYGEPFDGLITDTDKAPVKIVAVEAVSGNEIVLFDGAEHGYNAMFCDKYSPNQKQNRTLTDLDGYTYRVLIHLYYNIDYEDEYEDFVNSEGQVPLIDGRVISFDSLKRNGFDAISVDLIDEKQSVRELLNEELS